MAAGETSLAGATAARAAVARNALTMIASQMGAKGLAFVVAIVLARYLGSVEYGHYSTVVTYLLLYSAAGDLGLTLLVMREVGRDPALAPRYLSAYLAAQSIAAMLLLVVPLAGAGAARIPGALLPGVALAAAALALETLSRPFSAILLGLERMTLNAAVIAGASVTSSAATVAGVLTHQTLLYFLAVAVLAAAVQVGLAAGLCLGHGARPARLCGWGSVRRLVVQAAPYALLTSITILYNRVDILLLAALRGPQVVGWYAAAVKIVEALLLIPANAAAACVPRMARAHTAGTGEGGDLAGRALRLLLPAGLLIGLLGSLLGPPLVRHVYGAAFAPTGTALAILAWAVALACPTSILACALQAARRTSLLALLVAVALAANVALNLVLIPRLSLLGPCLATVAGEALLLVLLVIASGRFAKCATAGGTLPRLLLATAGGAGAAGALVAAGPLCQAALGTTVFLSLLALTGYMDPREWAHLRACAPWRQGTIRD